MKKSTLALIVAATVVGVLMLAAVVVGIGWMAVKGVKTNAPTAEERKLVVTPEAFAEFGQTLDPRCDSLKTTNTFGLSKEIEYEHECQSPGIYIRSTASISATAHDARQTWLLLIGGYKAGVAIAGSEIKVEPRENLVTFGDQRYGAMLRRAGEDVGNVFVIRQGRVVHSLLVTGLYFDEPDAVRDLLAPVIEESRRQYGKKK